MEDTMYHRDGDLPTIEQVYEQAPSYFDAQSARDCGPYFGRDVTDDGETWADLSDGSYVLGLHALGARLLGHYEDRYQHLKAAQGEAAGADPLDYNEAPNHEACQEILEALEHVTHAANKFSRAVDASIGAAKQDALTASRNRDRGDR